MGTPSGVPSFLPAAQGSTSWAMGVRDGMNQTIASLVVRWMSWICMSMSLADAELRMKYPPHLLTHRVPPRCPASP